VEIIGFILQVLGVLWLIRCAERAYYRTKSGGWTREQESAMRCCAQSSHAWVWRYRNRAERSGYQGYSAVILVMPFKENGPSSFDDTLIDGWDWEPFDSEDGSRVIRGLAWRHKVQNLLDSSSSDLNKAAAGTLRQYSSTQIGIISIDNGFDI